MQFLFSHGITNIHTINQSMNFLVQISYCASANFPDFPGNKNKSRIAHMALYQSYSHLRAKYYQKILKNTTGNSSQLFQLRRTGKKPQSSLPIFINYNGETKICRRFKSSYLLLHRISNEILNFFPN